ncbi:MAG: DUF4194 domain-containing protein [Thermoguttaceae bacterium]
MPSTGLPEFREWSIAAVRLLQGAVYATEPRVWNLVLGAQSHLEGYFGRLGLLLVVDEPEGLAYLRQASEDELPDGYEGLPKLFRKTRLGYEATLLCVLLREELRKFEEEDVHNERCVVEMTALFDQWTLFFPSHGDQVRQRRELSQTLGKLEDLGFIGRFSDEPETWEIRRILKARLQAAELESLKVQLASVAGRRAEDDQSNQSNG